MSDYDNVIDDYFEAPARQAALSIDDSPDRAVRARQLSKATGQPQLAVYNDLDRADQEHKADLTRMIVGRNDKLSAYIRGEPLAAVVSNDDYGNLDNLSKEVGDLTSISGITKHILSDVFRAPIKGAEVMAEQAMQPYWFNKNFPEFAAKNPYSTALYNLPEAALRTLSIPFAGIAGAAGEYAKTAVTAITADPMQGERAGRDIGGMVDYYFMGVTGHMPHTYGEMIHAKQFDNAVRSSQREFYHEALAAAKPYLDAGLEVPRGVHPLVDSLKANVNAEWVDKAEKVLNSSFDSATKERDPDLFHSYSKIEFEDSQMGISGDKVAALYGDKLPTPDDGLLGWVPGIAEKLEAARMFGEDVHVSMADWLTHMDPALFKELRDDVRAWPGGITKNEAALKDVAAPAIDGALPQVRTSAALEPMFAIGDRPLKLEKLESKYKQMEEYNFVDHTGKVIGDITIFPDPLKKQLYIASVASHDLQPNTMGPSLVRDIKRQLKELYPDYETVTGYRISGAREEAGAPKDQRKPIVKLALSDAFEMSKEYNDLRNILDTAPTKFGDVTADIKPTELYSKHEQAFLQAGQEELNRITGKTAKLILASNIRYEGIDDIRGVYHKMPGEVAKIIISALDFDKGGILRHEAIHHLYREGFFKPEEWNALIEASKTEGWRERYDIDARYEHLNELGLHEEAIAEAFRDWAKTREQQPINPVTTVFQKIWDLMQRIKDRVAEILGREPKFDELFEAAYSGEIANRQSGEGIAGSTMGLAAKPFYSAVQKIVDSGKLIKGTADQWLGMLKNTAGIKPEEMKWLGLENWLREQKGSVTKEQVSDYVRANQLQVNEVVKGALPRVDKSAVKAASHQAQQAYADFTLALDERFPDGFKVHDEVVPSDAIAHRLIQGEMSYTELPKDIQPLAEILIASDVAYYDAANVSRPKEETKYDRYKLHGGNDYRELLLTLPEKGEGKRTPGWGADAEWHDKNFESSHWDEANVLAHVRYDERTGPNGERILHIAEIQSDWHQEGRKRGYKDLSSAEEANGYRVADAPLKNSWPEFAMKRMIRMAAENGFDKISWDTGKTNADRYGLRKELSRIVLSDNSSGGVGKPSMEGPFQGGLLKAYNKQGREVVNRWIEDEASLADHIGQEVAKKLLSAEPKESYDSGMGGRRRSLEDAELDVGGEGMKGFYDKILPETVNKLVKKYGAKVESGKVETTKEFIRDPKFGNYYEEMQYADVHQFDLTGKLKETAVEQGFPAFAKGEIENYLKAEAVGLDAKHKKKLDELLQKEYEENLAAAIKRAEAEQRTIQSKEWKEAAKEIRKEAENDVRARPDVQADLLIGSGELGGKKLERQRYELLSDDLSPEQKAMLPRHYYAKDGVPVDAIANLFGYSDGNHLIEALAEVNKGKEGRSAQENLKRLIDEETNRRMEAKFGKLQDNIMLDAMDQAFSETALNRIAEEWQGAAMQAGVQVIDKNLAKEEAQRIFSNMKVADINVERLVGIMGKLGRDAERALIAGKYADASVMMQRKYSTALIIAEAKKLEKERAGFDRTYDQMRKREIKSMEPEYTDMVHQIYQLIDKPVQRSIQDLQDSLARNEYKNLADFVEKKQNALRVVDAWEPLMEGNWKKSFNDLTVDEFRGVNGTIKNLVHNGKEERKIYKAGEAADFAELKGEFIQSIVDAAHGDFAKLNKGKYAKLPEQYFVQHIQMETFLNRLDGYDPNGVWFQYVYRDLADGAAQVDIWRKHFSKRLKDVPQPKNLHRTLDNPLFKDQDTGLAIPFTRRNLIAVMLNTGNSTNLKKLAEGYKLRSDDIMAWVNQHATKAEFDYVQHIWDVFAEIKEKSDTMYRSLAGVAPENIEIRPIDTPHGQYKGGYYPLIREPNQVGEGTGKVFGRDALLQENFVSAMPPAGYTKKRTGAIYPLSLEPDMMTNQMSQMLHDIALRPALINASKIMMNKEIQSKIRAHFGDAWKDELKDYLVGVANAQNYMPQNQKAIMELAEFARQNVISTVIGFNPGTVMKHGPTALGLSIKEVGFTSFVSAAREAKIFRNVLAEVAPESYRSAVRSLLMINDATSNKTWNFIMENSLELQRRVRNWQETLFGATAGLQPFDKYATFRSNVMQLASHPVALSDMLSAVPTWLAKYKEAQAAGKDHGESVTLGDRAVRRAHGSTASTSRTSFQRNYNPYLTSVYNFWSDILNRQVETIWRAGDEAKLTNGNPVQKGLATVPILAGGLLAYSIWPAIVESHVSPHPHGDDESFVWRALKQFAFTEMGGWVGIRDAATAFAFARDPHYGFTGTAWQGLTNLPRDLLRKEPLNKERVGKLIQDGAALMGTLTGSFPLQIGKSARYVYGVKSGQENPRNVWQWLVGLRFGTNDKHSRSFEEYWKGH